MARDRPSKKPQNEEHSTGSTAEATERNTPHSKNSPLESLIRSIKAEYIYRIEQQNAHIKQIEADYAHEMHRHDEYIRELKQDMGDLERKLGSMVHLVQEATFRSIQGGWTPKEDRVIRSELVMLQGEVRKWAKKYTFTGLADINSVPRNDREVIMKQLKGYSAKSDWESLIRKMPVAHNIIPALLVQALLSENIFGTMFTNPFFVLNGTKSNITMPKAAEMRNLYETMIQANSAEAHIWRSQMLRVLSTIPESNSKPLLSHMVREISIAHAASFLINPGQVLLRPTIDDDQMKKRELELQAVYQRAGDLALTLWTQRTFMDCRSQQHLGNFNATSPIMYAHRLHKLDENDRRLDGKKVLFCVHPAVLAFGTEDAEDYGSNKVWAKATVLVDEET